MRLLMHAWIKIKTMVSLLMALALSALCLASCQDPPPPKAQPGLTIISVKISQAETSSKVIDRSAVPKAESVPDPVSSPEPAPREDPPFFAPSPLDPYSPLGKIDPFRPLIQTRTETAVAAVTAPEKPTRILTPLEKFDLSQIRLVAVVRSESGRIAMVEEASGKGYVVRIGTYIGKDGGAVEQILEDRIVIREMVKDFKGEAVSRIREMKLHKQVIEG